MTVARGQRICRAAHGCVWTVASDVSVMVVEVVEVMVDSKMCRKVYPAIYKIWFVEIDEIVSDFFFTTLRKS